MGQISFLGAVKLNILKLTALTSIKKFKMQGKAFVALKPGEETTEMDFNETRDIPPDLAEKMVKELAIRAARMLLGF